MKTLTIIALCLLIIGGCKKNLPNPSPKTYQTIVSWDTTINKSRLTYCSGGSLSFQTIDDGFDIKYFKKGSDTLYYTEKDSCFAWSGGVLTTVLKTKPIMRVYINSKLAWMDTLMVGNQAFDLTLDVRFMDYLIKKNKI